MAQELSITSLIEAAAKLPFVHIDRKEFLSQTLSKLCTPEQLHKAIEEGTLHAGIPIEFLDSLANDIINAETIKVTAISAAAGIPGGLAMMATIPADLAQFYGFAIRVAQKLAYLYGWQEMFTESSELDAATESQIVLFIGVMFGVNAANKVVTKLFGETAMKAVAKKVAAKALTKTWYYPIVKRVAAMLGQRVVKASFARGISKAVPFLGGAISGGLTLATFKPMSIKLKNHLSKMAHMSPEEFARYEASIVIDAEDMVIDGEIVENATEAPTQTHWKCTCGAEIKSNFCSECGKAKPADLPTYKCDKCGWEPEDRTHPPKFCPECGDQFTDEDIVLT